MSSVWQNWIRRLQLADGVRPVRGLFFSLVLGLIVLAVGGLAVRQHLAFRTPYIAILGGQSFSDHQLGMMAKAFAQAKLTGHRIHNGRIEVAAGQEPQYLAALAECQALPRDFQSHTDAAIDQGHLLESDRERQWRIQHAREKDLALAIRAMRGIENAMVQYDEAQAPGFSRQRLVTASVAVLVSEGHVLDRRQIRTIRRLVAWAKAGLRPEDVNVTDLRSGTAFLMDDEQQAALPLAEERRYLQLSLERDWQSKIIRVLQFVPSAQVVVSVDLPPIDMSQEAETTALPDPARLAVSVGIPDAYLRSVLRVRQDRTGQVTMIPEPEDLDRLRAEIEQLVRSAVQALLPAASTTQSSIAVTVFEEPRGASHWRRLDRQAWTAALMRHRTVLAIIGGLMVATAVLCWTGRKRPRVDEGDATIRIRPFAPAAGNAAHRQPNDLGNDDDERELRATLTDLVRDDPNHAARVLHRWIERAG
jgi:flagellar biosynthesis/type III secretory pathway M-ring protein FliF/YscJ